MLEYEILKHLKDNYNEDYIELLDFFLEKYPDADIATLKHVHDALINLTANKFIDAPQHTLSDIYKQIGQLKQIRMNESNESFQNLSFIDLVSIKKHYVADWAIPAKITTDGRKELDNLLMQEKVKEANQSVIDTNTSIKGLNTNTETFYKKQEGYNNTQKNLTYVIAFAALLSATSATCTFLNDRKNNEQSQQLQLQQVQTTLRQLGSTLQSQIKIDSAFQKMVKDSLKKTK